jgi:hypothetical protein
VPDTSKLAQDLAKIGYGDFSNQAATLTALQELLITRNSMKLLEVYLDLVRMKDELAISGFDSCMGALTVEPLMSSAEQWRALAITTMFKRPEGASLNRIDNARVIEEALAKIGGFAPDAVKLVRHPLNTRLAFSLNPVEAHNYCSQLKLALLSGVSPDGRIMLPPTPDSPAECSPDNNFWISPDTDEVGDECVMIVLLRQDELDVTSFHARIPQFIEDLRSIEVEYAMDERNGTGSTVAIAHRVLAAGSPWNVFRKSLHTRQAYEVMSLLNYVCIQEKAVPQDISVTVARMDMPGTSDYSVRVGLQLKDRLVAGFAEDNLEEPDHLVALLHEQFEPGFGVREIRYFIDGQLDIDEVSAATPKFRDTDGCWTAAEHVEAGPVRRSAEATFQYAIEQDVLASIELDPTDMANRVLLAAQGLPGFYFLELPGFDAAGNLFCMVAVGGSAVEITLQENGDLSVLVPPDAGPAANQLRARL